MSDRDVSGAIDDRHGRHSGEVDVLGDLSVPCTSKKESGKERWLCEHYLAEIRNVYRVSQIGWPCMAASLCKEDL